MDETTKYGQQYLSTTIRTADGETLVFLMNEKPNKSAQTTLDILKEELADADRASGRPDVAHHILLQIKSTMSDRAATEILFNKLFQAYKEEICPKVIGNWTALNGNEKLAWTQVENFFCSLHLLANFAEIISECMLEHEAGVAMPEQLGSLIDQTGFQSNEAGVYRVIRTVAKCFARRGSEFGLYQQWRLFWEH
uniref:Uncharacterized protein n=1 Tax=Plectus sambesii TaxID=2011161 RepID=A0A914VV74_9BILA